jgi:hypothetical protein
MIERAFDGLYWPAIIVAGVATFMLGGVWYQALFGKLWVRLHGYTEAQQAEIRAKRPPGLFFGGMIAGYTALALVVAVIAGIAGASSATDAIALGALLWLVLTLGSGFTTWLARGDHLGTLLIDAAYQLVFSVGMSLIVVLWTNRTPVE